MVTVISSRRVFKCLFVFAEEGTQVQGGIREATLAVNVQSPPLLQLENKWKTGRAIVSGYQRGPCKPGPEVCHPARGTASWVMCVVCVPGRQSLGACLGCQWTVCGIAVALCRLGPVAGLGCPLAALHLTPVAEGWTSDRG